MALGVAPYFLVVANVWLLKVIAAAHQQKFDVVVVSRAPVKLHGGTAALAEVVQLMRFGGIEKASGSKAIDKEVIAQPALLPAVIGVEIVVVDCGATEVNVSVPSQVGSRPSGNV